MRPAVDIDQFMADPVGRYVAGASFIVWVDAPDLLGNIYFGRSQAGDLGPITRMYQLPRHRALAPPYDVVIDCHRLEIIDLRSYEVFLRYSSSLMPAFAPLVRRCAIVRPRGLAGTTLTGLFHELIKPQLPADLFDEPRAAFGWLGRTDAAVRVEELLSEARATSPRVQLLRDFLAAQLRDVTLAMAARRLSSSERSLQRELEAAGTSFRAELNRARMTAARALLLDSDLPIDEVARRVGCVSLPHFSELFRKYEGIPPSEFRARRGANS